jgi:hypothetical protein
VGDIRGKGGKRCEIGWEWVRMGENGRKWVKMGVNLSENGRKWAKMGGVGDILANDIKQGRV